MLNILLIILIIVIVTIVGILAWLLIEQKKLKQNLKMLNDCVERNNKDIAGLCSAALNIDTKLSDEYEQIRSIEEKVSEFEHKQEQAGQPYHSAIQMVRNGANAEELIKQYGLNREEAMLLIRMHGQ